MPSLPPVMRTFAGWIESEIVIASKITLRRGFGVHSICPRPLAVCLPCAAIAPRGAIVTNSLPNRMQDAHPQPLRPRGRLMRWSSTPTFGSSFLQRTRRQRFNDRARYILSFRDPLSRAWLRVEFPHPTALRRGFWLSVLVPPTVYPQKIHFSRRLGVATS
jgi:hypothetical protein